jgi:hypothetical protein
MRITRQAKRSLWWEKTWSMLARPRYIGAGALEEGSGPFWGGGSRRFGRVVAMRWLAQRSCKALSVCLAERGLLYVHPCNS